MGGRQFPKSVPKKSKQPEGTKKEEPEQPTTPMAIRRSGIDTSLFVSVILGLLALVGLLLQWNGVIAVRWAWSLPMYAVVCISAVYVFWRWETARNWNRTPRYLGVSIMGLVFTAASGLGIVTQYRRENPPDPMVVLEQNIKEWAHANHWPLTPIAGTIDGKPVPFEFMIGLPSTAHVLVFVNKVEWPRILQMQSKLFFSQDQLEILNSLSADEARTVMQEFQLEMTRQKLNWKIDTQADEPKNKFNGLKFIVEKQSILLSNPTPIDSLNEFSFSKAIADMDNDVGFVYNQMDLILKSHAKKGSVLAKPSTKGAVKAADNEQIPFGPQPKYPPWPRDFPGLSFADLKSQEELLTLSDGELRKRVGDLAVRLKAFDGSWTFHPDDRPYLQTVDNLDGTPNPESMKRFNDEMNRRYEEDKQRDVIYMQQFQEKFPELSPTHDELVSRCKAKDIDMTKLRSCDKYGSPIRAEGATNSAECLESMVRRCLN